MNQNNRAYKRLPFQQDCLLSNRFGKTKGKTVDVSRMGLGVKTDNTWPFGYNSCKLTIFIPSKNRTFLTELMWIRKYLNTLQLGLKLSTSLIG